MFGFILYSDEPYISVQGMQKRSALASSSRNSKGAELSVDDVARDPEHALNKTPSMIFRERVGIVGAFYGILVL